MTLWRKKVEPLFRRTSERSRGFVSSPLTITVLFRKAFSIFSPSFTVFCKAVFLFIQLFLLISVDILLACYRYREEQITGRNIANEQEDGWRFTSTVRIRSFSEEHLWDTSGDRTVKVYWSNKKFVIFFSVSRILLIGGVFSTKKLFWKENRFSRNFNSKKHLHGIRREKSP